MSLFRGNNRSNYVKSQLEEMHSEIAPLTKKSMIFTFIAIPLLFSSIFNLYFLITYAPSNAEIGMMVLIFCVTGAVGMAFFKESKYYNKEIHNTSFEYIEKRIKKSEVINDYSKEKYLDQLHSEPYKSVAIFLEFLQQEENTNKHLGK
ncbi:DUF5392 family protein [Evansella sp. AB-rgal1]|uniref:DUF5392 family protein n=1 Tax=Evansella sp. AB-rgal1 TaxID=3242696 RepID=UPI00359DBA89